MKEKEIAVQNYKRFCALEGSDYIASEFALEMILKLIKAFNLKTILEVGMGIGSIADTVFKFSKVENRAVSYTGTEKNEFCLQALKKNVEDYNQIEWVEELVEIKNKKFDFIIIDGYDDALNIITTLVAKNAIVFIEGDRRLQTELILSLFPKARWVNVITFNKNKSYAHGEGNPNHYVGGGQLIFCNPTFKMQLYWFVKKIDTFIKNKIRT
jgi:spore coat polysaccharide biosynthesis predicted glycosyltransferase SpsG